MTAPLQQFARRFEFLQCGYGEDAVDDNNHAEDLLDHCRLQCGHGEDAVDDQASWKLSPELIDLQCGHGEDAVDDTC